MMAEFTRRTFFGAMGAASRIGARAWNPLLITNDQHRADCLRVGGNPVLQIRVAAG